MSLARFSLFAVYGDYLFSDPTCKLPTPPCTQTRHSSPFIDTTFSLFVLTITEGFLAVFCISLAAVFHLWRRAASDGFKAVLPSRFGSKDALVIRRTPGNDAPVRCQGSGLSKTMSSPVGNDLHFAKGNNETMITSKIVGGRAQNDCPLGTDQIHVHREMEVV